ncbi:MAG: 50S ribosomal protein L29 [Anaerolineales bacterium]|jgi:large subunit ribosomal protein L29|nr:50S ribosomal protein L29 [Anaerolineales bacterium]
MKITEIRELSDDELKARISDFRQELMNLRFQQSTGELTDHTRLSFTRRIIARILTELRERELMEMEGEG